MTLTDLGITLRRLGRGDEALKSFLRSAELLESLPKKWPYNHYSLACAYAQASAVAVPEGSDADGPPGIPVGPTPTGPWPTCGAPSTSASSTCRAFAMRSISTQSATATTSGS